MLFVHAADLHLDSPARNLAGYEGAPVERVRVASRQAFRNLIDLTISSGARLLVLAGDLFDGDWTDYGTGQFFINELDRLGAHGVRVVTIAGNHDAATVITRSLTMPAHVTVCDTEHPQRVRFDDLGIDVVGQGFASRHVSDDLGAAFPVAEPGWFTIGLLHTSLDGRPPHDVYAPTTVSKLRTRGYQYWALGHVHHFEEVATDPWIVYPGNLQGRHLRERGPKGAVVVEIAEGAVASVKHHALDVVRWERIHVDLSELADLRELPDTVASAAAATMTAADGRLVVAQLVLEGATKHHAELLRDRSRVQAELEALGNSLGDLYVHSVKFATSPPVDREALLADETIHGLAARVSQLQASPELLEDYRALLKPLRDKVPAALEADVGLDALGDQLDMALETVLAALANAELAASEGVL
jgi:DNA repair exonuclease SbcCD nuclease subunit